MCRHLRTSRGALRDNFPAFQRLEFESTKGPTEHKPSSQSRTLPHMGEGHARKPAAGSRSSFAMPLSGTVRAALPPAIRDVPDASSATCVSESAHGSGKNQASLVDALE
mgnify:CR=1 FL=1